MIFQVGFLAVLILIPLIYTEALPKTMMATLLVAPPPPPPPPPPPIVQVVHMKPQVHLMDAGKLVAPKVIPKEIKIIKEDAPDMSRHGRRRRCAGGVAGGSDGRRHRRRDWWSWRSATTAEARAAGAHPPGWQRASGQLVNKVQPVYPPLARQTRISGTVRLHAIIAKNGTVEQLEVISGPPAVGSGRDGRRKAVALSANTAER